MAEKRVIYFPKTLLATSDVAAELSGFVRRMNGVRYYFILPGFTENPNAECKVERIGHFVKNGCQSCSDVTRRDVLCITEIDGNLNASLLPGQPDNFVLVIYDPSRLYDYGTLHERDGVSQKFVCFTMLSKWLSSTKTARERSDVLASQRLPRYLLIVLNVLINSFETKLVQLTILRLTLFKHILGVIKNLAWLTENVIYKKQMLSKSKAINYFMSCVCDAFFGMTMLYLLNSTFTTSNELFACISSVSHVRLFSAIEHVSLYDILIRILSVCMVILIYSRWSRCFRVRCNG